LLNSVITMQKKSFVFLLVAVFFIQAMAFGSKFTVAQVVPNATPFVHGVGSGPVDLDPAYMYDSASIDVATQVAEGLYAYDLSTRALDLVPRLAADQGTWSSDNLNFTVKLRQNVVFHDGTSFNATAVKWTFDRLMRFVDNTTAPTQINTLYTFDFLNDGTQRDIIKRTEVVDTYTVRFVLNGPYSPFKALLTFSGSFILSPTSTPANSYLDLTTGKIVGTGPFKYVDYVAGEKVDFVSNELYYRGAPAIKTMVWEIFPDDDTKNLALLSGAIQGIDAPLPSYLDQIDHSTTSYIINGTGGTIIQRTIIQYMGFNNHQINKTYRQAMSYAIDYNYYLTNIMHSRAVRLNSCIPIGIQYANWSNQVAVLNVTKARQILIAAGLAGGLTLGSSDVDWETKADGGSPVGSFNFTYNVENNVRDQIGTLVASNMREIGIKVVKVGLTWANYLNLIYGIGGHSMDELGMFAIGWQPDYNDPSDFINPLFGNTSTSNDAQVNDPDLQNWMNLGVSSTDSSARATYYNNIQKYVVEDLMPWAFLSCGKATDAMGKNLTHFEQNAMGIVYFYPCCWNGVCPNINEAGGIPTELISGYNVFVMLGIGIATFGLIVKIRKH
jgi:ABC-type transport system substrate-binding protein